MKDDSTPDPDSKEPRRVRGGWRDVWQLHVPLVLVLSLCTVATIIEAQRASEGVWRAWAYMVEWPLIGLFTIWIWHRYRTEGSVTKGLIDRWRERVTRLGAEADGGAEGAAVAKAPAVQEEQPATDDPELDAWTSYVEDLRRREPPGSPLPPGHKT